MMIRVWRFSGEKLADIGDVTTCKCLKRKLRMLHGIPVSLQQLVKDNRVLDDATLLNASADLLLVLLPAPSAPQDSVATELILESSKGDVKTVRSLLDARADVDRRNPSGCTALMCASAYGHVEVVQMLLEAGADKDLHILHGHETALGLASRNNHREVSRVLWKAGARYG